MSRINVSYTHSFLVPVIGLLAAVEEVCAAAKVTRDKRMKCCFNITEHDGVSCACDVDGWLTVAGLAVDLKSYDRDLSSGR